MVQTKIMECPSCGAALPRTEGVREVRCEYCGSLVTLEDDRTETVRETGEKPKTAEHHKTEEPLSPEDGERVKRLGRYYRIWKAIFIAFTVLSLFLIAPERDDGSDTFWAGVLIEAVAGWCVVGKKGRKEALREAVLREKHFSEEEKAAFLRLRRWRRISIGALMLGGLLTSGESGSDVWVTAAIVGTVGWCVTARKLREL